MKGANVVRLDPGFRLLAPPPSVLRTTGSVTLDELLEKADRYAAPPRCLPEFQRNLIIEVAAHIRTLVDVGACGGSWKITHCKRCRCRMMGAANELIDLMPDGNPPHCDSFGLQRNIANELDVIGVWDNPNSLIIDMDASEDDIEGKNCEWA